MSELPPKDKRTKAYKEWVKKHGEASSGLGDTVEKITKATGIKKVVDTVFQKIEKDCGCEERKKRLNEKFRYEKPECFLEEEFNLIHRDVEDNKRRFTPEDQAEYIKIFERVYNTRVQGCSSCAFKDTIFSKLVTLYREYL